MIKWQRTRQVPGRLLSIFLPTILCCPLCSSYEQAILAMSIFPAHLSNPDPIVLMRRVLPLAFLIGGASLATCALIYIFNRRKLISIRESNDNVPGNATDQTTCDKLIGNTPLVKLAKLSEALGVDIFVKVKE